jgi:GntR family transcriptional regulator
MSIEPVQTVDSAASRELPSAQIERTSPVPYYFQLARAMERALRAGRWPPGSVLPSEAEIGEFYGVSRTTVRQALSRLERDGLVYRLRGKGTYAAEREAPTWRLEFSEDAFHGMGTDPAPRLESRLLRAEVTALPFWASAALRLPPGSDGILLERTRALAGEVVLFVINHLPPAYTAAVLPYGDPNQSVHDVLRDRANLVPAGGRRTLQAVTAGDRIAGFLDVSAGEPVALIETISWNEFRSPFACSRAWVVTDRLRVEVALSAEATDHNLS